MRHLLVIDDEPHVARVIQVSFERRGWAVSAAPQLELARKLLKSRSFDVVFLDVKLPDGSGLEFLAEIRDELAPATPVVVLSGAEFEDVRERVRSLGAEYVAKPFSPTKLQQLTTVMLDEQNQ